jgi:hypothetical protein
MSTILRRSSNHAAAGRRAKNSANRPHPSTPITIVSASAGDTALVLALDQPVSLSGTPAITVNVAGAVPLSAIQQDETHIMIVFDRDIGLATTMSIPWQDPAIRNATGGFIIATAVTLS